MRIICSNVGELRAALAKLPPLVGVYTVAPPFHAVELIEQSDGRILITAPKGKQVVEESNR